LEGMAWPLSTLTGRPQSQIRLRRIRFSKPAGSRLKFSQKFLVGNQCLEGWLPNVRCADPGSLPSERSVLELLLATSFFGMSNLLVWSFEDLHRLRHSSLVCYQYWMWGQNSMYSANSVSGLWCASLMSGIACGIVAESNSSCRVVSRKRRGCVGTNVVQPTPALRSQLVCQNPYAPESATKLEISQSELRTRREASVVAHLGTVY